MYLGCLSWSSEKSSLLGPWRYCGRIESVQDCFFSSEENSQPNNTQTLANNNKERALEKCLNWVKKFFGHSNHFKPFEGNKARVTPPKDYSTKVNKNLQNSEVLQKTVENNSRHKCNTGPVDRKKFGQATIPLEVFDEHLGNKKIFYSSSRRKSIITTQVRNLRRRQMRHYRIRFVSLTKKSQEENEIEQRLKNAIIKPRKVYKNRQNDFHYALGNRRICCHP